MNQRLRSTWNAGHNHGHRIRQWKWVKEHHTKVEARTSTFHVEHAQKHNSNTSISINMLSDIGNRPSIPAGLRPIVCQRSRTMPEDAALQLPSIDDLLGKLDELERRLADMNAEVSTLHRLSMLGVLTAGIAHEINNLLTPVLSYAQLALAKPDDRELCTKALQRAQAGAQSAAEVIHAILGLTRGEDGRTCANVAEVVQEALRCLGRDPAKDSVTVERRVPDHIRVAAQPVALQQVLLNLLLNSLKALKGRPGTITIAARERAGQVTIEVSDDGPGIPVDVLPTVFDPPSIAPRVRRRHPKHADKQQGTGVGLSICRQLIESANGTIECTSSTNNGTTFTIVMPSAPMIARKAG